MKQSITIGWLYPELMSTYGDRGNIFVLKNRVLLRNIDINIEKINYNTSTKSIHKCNIIFGGGAQDRQQSLLIDDLRLKKGPILKKLFENGIPGLFVCGAPQLLGHSYMTGDGKVLKGLGILDMESKHFGKDKPRCIGNIIADIGDKFKLLNNVYKKTIVGFENHGGRTYISPRVKPFARVIVGFGNNGEDGTEGAIYNNCIATYFHGPFLPKNPHIADWLIAKAVEIKYGRKLMLMPLDDSLEWKAHEYILNRFFQ